MENNETKYCPECQVGVFRSEGATYYTWIDDELITVPDFPCWVCDVCGHRDWDNTALMQLNILLSPNAGQKTTRAHIFPTKENPESEKRVSSSRRRTSANH